MSSKARSARTVSSSGTSPTSTLLNALRSRANTRAGRALVALLVAATLLVSGLTVAHNGGTNKHSHISAPAIFEPGVPFSVTVSLYQNNGPETLGVGNTVNVYLDVTPAGGSTTAYGPLVATQANGATVVFPLTLTGLVTHTLATRVDNPYAGTSVTIARSPVDTTPPVVGPVSSFGIEATSPAGAIVTYATPTATDNVDPVVVVTCLPASGTLFPLGSTTVTCNASDTAGNAATPVSFTVVVHDRTAPTWISPLPAVLTLPAQDASGYTVPTFVFPTATDIVDPAPVVTCLIESTPLVNGGPITFPIGSTQVFCRATDASGNVATQEMLVSVTDVTAPVVTQMADIQVRAESDTGRIIDYTLPTVTDNVATSITPVCSPPPGTLFPVGSTPVTCNAQDRAGNAANPMTFWITVLPPLPADTPPVVSLDSLPAMPVAAASVAGTVVSFVVSATDDDAVVSLACVPPSGSLFPVGATLVACTATDTIGQIGTMDFTVTVAPFVASNDNFADAIVIAALPFAHLTSTDVATTETGEPSPCGGIARTVWYRWTAPSAGTATIDTIGSSYDTVLAVYTGSALGSLTAVACNDDTPGLGLQSRVTFDVAQGTVYHIQVGGFAGRVGQLNLQFAALVPSPVRAANDHFADATEITTLPFRSELRDLDLTIEVGEIRACGGSFTAWYRWTAPEDALATIHTLGSDVDTRLAVYTGSSLTSLSNVLCNSNHGGTAQSLVEFAAVQGTTYHIQVATVTSFTSNLVLVFEALESTAPPANDNFANAITIAVAPFSTVLSTRFATLETSEPRPCASIGSTVWYRWTAPYDGQLTLETFGSNYDTAVAVYTGSAIDALTNLGCNDDAAGTLQSRLVVGVVDGTTYMIQFGGFSSRVGHLTLTLLTPDGVPTVTVPASLVLDATSPAGAVGTFAATATSSTGSVPVVCTPASGSTFPVGTTTVSCTATATSGASSTRTFRVSVLAYVPPPQPPVGPLASIVIDGPADVPVSTAITHTAVGFDASGNRIGVLATLTRVTPAASGPMDVCHTESDITGCLVVSVSPGALSRIAMHGPSIMTAGSTASFSVRGYDVFGNPRNIATPWVSYTAPTAPGVALVTHSEGGVIAQQQVAVIPDVIARVVVDGPTTLGAGETATYTVTAYDRFGNEVALPSNTLSYTAPRTGDSGEACATAFGVVQCMTLAVTGGEVIDVTPTPVPVPEVVPETPETPEENPTQPVDIEPTSTDPETTEEVTSKDTPGPALGLLLGALVVLAVGMRYRRK